MYLFKRISVLVLGLLPILAFGQIPVQRSPATVTVMDSRLKANLNLGTPHYADTTTANLWKGLDSIGNIITTGSHPIRTWIRDLDAVGTKKWTEVTSGGSTPGIDDVLAIGQSFSADRAINQLGKQFNITGNPDGGAIWSSKLTGTNGYYGQIANFGAVAYVKSAGYDGTRFGVVAVDSTNVAFGQTEGSYQFQYMTSSSDTSGLKPVGMDLSGKIARMTNWSGGTSLGRNLLARNGLRARNDTTITWNGALDTPTNITGGGVNTLRFSGISGGVKFDENPTFNTTSTVGYVWTASNTIGGGQWQSAQSGLLTRQNITSGTSGTVSSGNYLVTIDPSSTLASYTLTLPASPNDQDVVEVDFGGTMTSGMVVTSLTISPNTGQTILDNTPPGSATVDNTLRYVYRTSTAAWRRIKY